MKLKTTCAWQLRLPDGSFLQEPQVVASGTPMEEPLRLVSCVVEHSRSNDAEFQVLNKAADKLLTRGRPAAATLHLDVSETPCLSCLGALRQFQKAFPEVSLRASFSIRKVLDNRGRGRAPPTSVQATTARRKQLRRPPDLEGLPARGHVEDRGDVNGQAKKLDGPATLNGQHHKSQQNGERQELFHPELLCLGFLLGHPVFGPDDRRPSQMRLRPDGRPKETESRAKEKLDWLRWSGKDLFEALLVEPFTPDDTEERNHICIPRNCAGKDEISSEHCMNVKGSVLGSLLEAHQKAWLTAVEDVARRERDMAQLVMCFGLALCHFFFALMLGIPRIQILCMNPLQGTPSPLAPLMLLDLRRRVFEDRLATSLQLLPVASLEDLYAMRLPIYLPSIDFIARFWPEVRSLDTAQCYDGWFDRRLPRTRLTEPSAESESPLPEPFDLSDGGYEKVRTWLAPADYFAFPGITIFQSLAQLHASLADLDDAHSSHLDAVREQMASFAVQRREEAAQLLSRVLRPVVSDASGG
eukprot:g24803.t1